MITSMIFRLLAVFLALPFTVSAYAPQTFVPEVQFATVPLELPEGELNVLGTLENFPIMYETRLESERDLQVQLSQRFSQQPRQFSVIVVRVLENNRGVQEIARINPQSDEWTPMKDSALGFTLIQSPTVTESLTPGTYRIEVSTPDNVGPYMVSFGSSDESRGYFGMLADAYTMQQHFDYSIFRMLLSSTIYYPLGIVLLLYGLRQTWKYRSMISNNHVG